MVKHYSRHCDDYFSGTRDLTLEERGAYNDLIDQFYRSDGVLPDDQTRIARSMGVHWRTWKTLRTSLIAAGKIRIIQDQIVPNGCLRQLSDIFLRSPRALQEARTRWAAMGLYRWESMFNVSSGEGQRKTATGKPESSDSGAWQDQETRDGFARLALAELVTGGWTTVQAAEDADHPKHDFAVRVLLRAARAHGIGWISPERRSAKRGEG